MRQIRLPSPVSRLPAIVESIERRTMLASATSAVLDVDRPLRQAIAVGFDQPVAGAESTDLQLIHLREWDPSTGAGEYDLDTPVTAGNTVRWPVAGH
jgi:hypothetical protein